MRIDRNKSMRIVEDKNTKEKFYADLSRFHKDDYLVCINCKTKEYIIKDLTDLKVLSPEFLRIANTKYKVVYIMQYKQGVYHGFTEDLESVVLGSADIISYIL